jgi:predicted patatin/cPLA2 family phospholipase
LPETAKRLQEACCFSATVTGLHKMNNYILSQIGNASEVPVSFAMPSNYVMAQSVVRETLGIENI